MRTLSIEILKISPVELGISISSSLPSRNHWNNGFPSTGFDEITGYGQLYTSEKLLSTSVICSSVCGSGAVFEYCSLPSTSCESLETPSTTDTVYSLSKFQNSLIRLQYSPVRTRSLPSAIGSSLPA